MRELWQRIDALEHERGRLREALTGIMKENLELAERIHTLLERTTTMPACEDRADSDPKEKEKA